MKPESTPGVMRAYLENMLDEPQPVYLYYIEPHFRYDRPQKGRYRQFHQIGAEIIGEEDPILRREDHVYHEEYSRWSRSCWLIWLKMDYFSVLQKNVRNTWSNCSHFLKIKNISSMKLISHVSRTIPSDSSIPKNEDVKAMLTQAPKMTDFLKKDSLEFYNKVKEYLDILGVPYVEDHTLVRGLDYYSHTVWEFVDGSGRTQMHLVEVVAMMALQNLSDTRQRFRQLDLHLVLSVSSKPW